MNFTIISDESILIKIPKCIDQRQKKNLEGIVFGFEKISNTMVEPHWNARLTEYNHLVLEHN